MPQNAAIKNAARERQAQTGESYAEARAAVVAEHDEPIRIRLWFPEMHHDVTLDTPEARKAWHRLVQLDEYESDGELDLLAENYLGNSLANIAANALEDGYLGEVRAEVSKGYRFPAEDALWVSEHAGRTVTPEQVEYLVDHYSIADSDEFDGPNLGVVIQLLDQLPAELATTAILARYAAALDEADPGDITYPWPRSLPVSAVKDGLENGNPVDGRPTDQPAELERVTAIMRCAEEARDVAVLHQCIDIITAWMHKLADWSVQQQ
jgi:hypothetical protein